jgi:hypothetical protein
MQSHGWTLLFREAVIGQMCKLHAAAERAERNDPRGFESNANVKLFRALSRSMLETVPDDPSRDEYRQGNTLGRTIVTGGAPGSDSASVYSFATTPRPGSSSSPGATTCKPCALREAPPILARCSKRGSNAEIRLTAGRH